MKRLLVLCSTFPKERVTDSASFVYDLSSRLTEEYDVTILAPHQKGAKLVEKWGKVKVYRFKYFFERWERLTEQAILPNLKGNPLLYIQLFLFVVAEFFAILRIVKKERIDKIQAHWIVPQGFLAFLVNKMFKIPYHIISHGGDIFGVQSPIFAGFKAAAINNCVKMTAVSTAIRDEIRKKHPNVVIDIIPMGVDTDLFTPKAYKKSLRTENNIKGPFLLFVGRFSEKKGLKYLLKAMALVKKQIPSAKLIIIGSGEEKERMKKLITELDISDSVLFKGRCSRTELPKYYATADMFIGPSIQTKDGDMEGFGLVFAEAMSCNTTTICTDLPAVRDIIKDKETGYVVRQKDEKELSQIIVEVINNKKEADKVAAQGRDYVRSMFGWDTIAKKYIKHLA